jgi:hypothetical protein
MSSKGTVNINDMLSLANFAILAMTIYVIFADASIETNPYIDSLSLVLGLLLCFQTQILLFIEKKNHDPFILVLVYVTIFFYSLRLVTLTIWPSSLVFDRWFYGPGDSNFALAIIIVSNASLAAGLFSIKQTDILGAKNYKPKQPLLPMVLLGVTIVISLAGPHLSTEGAIGRIIGISRIFFEPSVVFLVLATFILLFWGHIKYSYKLALLIFAFFLVFVRAIVGSRSGMLEYFQYSLFLIIAIIPSFSVRLRTAITILFFAPLVFWLAYSVFLTATLSRFEFQDIGAPLSLSGQFQVMRESRALGDELSAVQLAEMTEQALGRLGFFDFTAEIIAHREMYSEIFSPLSYVKTFIDNVFTPGFDIFDYPRIANGLRQVYSGFGSLSKAALVDAYHSDQISIIAEFFLIFGYLFFVPLFFMGRLFKLFYSRPGNGSVFDLALRRVLLIVVFHKVLLSFGLDWLALDIPVMVCIALIIKRFFGVGQATPRVLVSAQIALVEPAPEVRTAR